MPLVLLRSQAQRGSAEIFVYTQNKAIIFSLSTETLDQLGLTILDARIITTADQYVLNSFQVIEQSGEGINDEQRKEQICHALRTTLVSQKTKKQYNLYRQSRQAKHFPIKSTVLFHDDPLNRHTIIELISTDRAGLLSQIGKIFIQQNVQLHDAKITTIGSRAEDLFYVTDAQGALLDDTRKQQLKTHFLEKLN